MAEWLGWMAIIGTGIGTAGLVIICGLFAVFT